MIQLPQLRVQDFQQAATTISVLRNCFDALVTEINRSLARKVVDVSLITGVTPEDAFPKLVTVPEFTPRTAVIGKVRNASDPTRVPTEVHFLHWDLSDNGDLRINAIPNLLANTNYVITLEIQP